METKNKSGNEVAGKQMIEGLALMTLLVVVFGSYFTGSSSVINNFFPEYYEIWKDS